MTFYGLGSYGVMAAIALVLSTAMGVIGTPTHRTRIYTSKDEKTARKAFLGQGILLFGWSFVTAIIGMSCFTIATMNGDTLASGDYAFAYMATNALPPIIGMLFMICGLSATMSSGDSDAISGVTILLTDVYPSITGKTIKEEDYAKVSRVALICTLALPSSSPCSSTTLSATSPPSWAPSCPASQSQCCWAASGSVSTGRAVWPASAPALCWAC